MLVVWTLLAACHLLVACDKEPTSATPPVTPALPAVPAVATTATDSAAPSPPKDEVKIMKEFWDTKNLKFYNEMRRGADGKWDRNGLGRAFFSSGRLEREGQYKNGKRVGIWIYYDPEGNETRRENRGDGALADPH